MMASCKAVALKVSKPTHFLVFRKKIPLVFLP